MNPKLARNILILIALMGHCFLLNAQEYDVIYLKDVGNPRGLNSENDVSGDTWTLLANGGQLSNTWLPTLPIPFDFVFYGDSLSEIKFSLNNVATFSISSSILPDSNQNLPSNVLPDKSIAFFWDSFTSSPPVDGDARIYTNVFGSAPYRQLWIKFRKFELGNPPATELYYSLVLEETTNKIFVVDQMHRDLLRGINITSTLGIQNNSVTALQFSDSLVGVDKNILFTVEDNDYHAFYVPKNNDLITTSVGLSKGAFSYTNFGNEVKLKVKNIGVVAESGFNIFYEIDDGTTGQFFIPDTLAPNESLTRAFSWHPVTETRNTISVWSEMSGDGDSFNDTLSVGISSVARKRLNFEEDFFRYRGRPTDIGWYGALNSDFGEFPITGQWGTWSETGFGNIGSTGSVSHLFQQSSLEVMHWLITPPIDMSNASPGTELRFRIIVTTSSGTTPDTLRAGAKFHIVASTDGITWQENYVLATFTNKDTFGILGDTVVLSLDEFVGEPSLFIAFVAHDSIASSGGAKRLFIDDVFVGKEHPIDLAVSYLSVGADGAFQPGVPIPAHIVITNLGTAGPSSAGTIDIFMDGVLSNSESYGVLNTGESDTIITTIVPHDTGSYSVVAALRFVSGDGNSVNDSAFTSLDIVVPVFTPFLEDFELFVGTALTNNWEHLSIHETWEADAGGTPASNTGPLIDHTLGNASGNYMYTHSSGTRIGDEFILESPLIDLYGLSEPMLEFWYHMYGSRMGNLHVDLWSNGAWVNDIVPPSIGQQQASQTDPYLSKSTDLSSFAGQVVRLRFRGLMTADPGGGLSDMAIDDVQIDEPPVVDNAVTNFLNLPIIAAGNSTVNFDVELTNLGTRPQPVDTFDLFINNSIVNSYSYAALNPGQSDTVAVTYIASEFTGDTVLAALRLASGDISPSNDTLSALVGPLTVTAGKDTAFFGQQATIPLTVTRFDSISSFQFSMHWDPTVASLGQIDQFGLPGMGLGNFGTTLADSGIITVSWNDPGGLSQSLPDSAVVFVVGLQMTGGEGESSSFSVDGVPTPIEFANHFLQPVPWYVIDGELAVSRELHQISGNTTHYNGLPVSQVILALTGDSIQADTSSPSGDYNFEVLGLGDYTITPITAPSSPPANGVTTLDIALVRRRILAIQDLDSPYKIIAADVNRSNSVSSVDLTLIRKLILGLDTAFVPDNELWSITSSDFVFPDSANPFPYETSRSYTNITDDFTDEDFVMIKRGDVNGTWAPSAPSEKQLAISVFQKASAPNNLSFGKTKESRAKDVGLKTLSVSQSEVTTDTVSVWLGSAGSNTGEEVVIPVVVEEFVDILTFQFSVHWDTNVVSFLSVDDFGVPGLTSSSFGIVNAPNGTLTVSWDDLNATGQTVSDGSVLFSIRFDVVGAQGNLTTVLIDGNPTLVEFANSQLEVLPVVTNPGVVVVGNAPQITNPVVDLVFNEDFGVEFVDLLSSIFSDPDGDSLTYSVEILSVGTTPFVSGDSLLIASSPHFHGVSVLEIQANDSYLGISDTFSVTVLSLNDPPILENLPDISFDEDSGTQLGLNQYLMDADHDTTQIDLVADVIFASTQTNEPAKEILEGLSLQIKGQKGLKVVKKLYHGQGGITIEVGPGDLIISIDSLSHVATFSSTMDSSGTFTVVFTAVDDSGASDTDTITVTVNPINDAPIQTAELSDTLVLEDSGLNLIYPSLSGIFVDPDGDVLAFAAVADTGVTPSIVSDSLFVEPNNNYFGTSEVWVTANDGQLTVSDTFLVEVLNINDPPSSATLLEPSDGDTIPDISDAVVFLWTMSEDVDGDTMIYSLILAGPGLDTVISDILDTVFSFDGSAFFQGTSTYRWSVQTADDSITVGSDTSEFHTPVVVGLTETVGLPTVFALHQNYPNPFNPSTTIKYDLPQTTKVVLKIYNLLGQNVITLVSKQQPGGYKSVIWNGRNSAGQFVGSGIYVYRIQAGDFVQSRKMLFLK